MGSPAAGTQRGSRTQCVDRSTAADGGHGPLPAGSCGAAGLPTLSFWTDGSSPGRAVPPGTFSDDVSLGGEAGPSSSHAAVSGTSASAPTTPISRPVLVIVAPSSRR